MASSKPMATKSSLAISEVNHFCESPLFKISFLDSKIPFSYLPANSNKNPIISINQLLFDKIAKIGIKI